MTITLEELTRATVDAWTRREESALRRLLCEWVSEIPPALVYQHGEMIGLCPEDADLGDYPFVLYRHSVRGLATVLYRNYQRDAAQQKGNDNGR